MRPEPNHYRALNLKKDATEDDIRRAYRRRVKESHPDATGRQEETDAFRAAREAWEVLGDREKRKAYDEGDSGGADRSVPPQPRPEHFSASRWDGSPRPGPDADIELILSLKEAERGGRFRIPLNRGGCPFCDSFGSIPGGACPFCGAVRGDLVLDLPPGVRDGTLVQLAGGRGGQTVTILVSVQS